MTTVPEAIDRYLRTGDCENDHPEWSGNSWWERAKKGHDDLLRALVAEVKKRSEGRRHHAVPDLDLTSWTRRKLAPMASGLFAADVVGFDLRKPRVALLDAVRRGDALAAAKLLRRLGLLGEAI